MSIRRVGGPLDTRVAEAFHHSRGSSLPAIALAKAGLSSLTMPFTHRVGQAFQPDNAFYVSRRSGFQPDSQSIECKMSTPIRECERQCQQRG